MDPDELKKRTKVGIAIEEADELIAILTSSVKTARSNLSKN